MAEFDCGIPTNLRYPVRNYLRPFEQEVARVIVPARVIIVITKSGVSTIVRACVEKMMSSRPTVIIIMLSFLYAARYYFRNDRVLSGNGFFCFWRNKQKINRKILKFDSLVLEGVVAKMVVQSNLLRFAFSDAYF